MKRPKKQEQASTPPRLGDKYFNVEQGEWYVYTQYGWRLWTP